MDLPSDEDDEDQVAQQLNCAQFLVDLAAGKADIKLIAKELRVEPFAIDEAPAESDMAWAMGIVVDGHFRAVKSRLVSPSTPVGAQI